MLSLTWQQVDLVKKRAWVSSSEMKAGHSLGIPLTAEAIQVLNTLPKTAIMFFNGAGERIDDCNTLAFQKAVKAAKVEPLRWHDLRHTWASWAVQSGVTSARSQLLGGWRSYSMVLAVSRISRRTIWSGRRPNQVKTPHKNRHSKGPCRESCAIY